MSTVCVVPSIRPESLLAFKEKWESHFRWHSVRLIVVLDGDRPRLEVDGKDEGFADQYVDESDRDLFCSRSDACRCFGFWFAAKYLDPTTVLTFDDDLYPRDGDDPIAAHLSVLHKPASLSWMNTGHGDCPVFRGHPYAVRAEATVQLSHGVWTGVGDFDGPTQLSLTPKAISDPVGYADLNFFEGVIPRGVLAPISGMSLAFTREAAPFVYYAKQGPSTPFDRFADIWMGVSLKREFDRRNWAVYTGKSKVFHSRHSNVFTNLRLESAGLDVNERWWSEGDSVHPYFQDFADCRTRYAQRMADFLGVPA